MKDKKYQHITVQAYNKKQLQDKIKRKEKEGREVYGDIDFIFDRILQPMRKENK